jgi:hypothetical protein
MVKSLAILAFIGATGGGAFILANSDTVIDGKVMAADLLKLVGKKGITDIQCDDRIPIKNRGAVFVCTVAANDGSTARIEYTMSRSSALTARVLDSTGATREEPRVPTSSDPWAN